MKSLLVAALAVAVAGLAGCDRAVSAIPTAPTALSSPAAPAAPAAIAVAVSGRTQLSVIGETTQLTATALFSDGSRRGVTGEATWTSSDPATLSVSATGLVTVVRFGRAFISASYDTRSAGQTVEAATPEK
jgi:hypothetical protein